MTRTRTLPGILFSAAIIVAGVAGAARAEDFSLNYETLSSLEEPLATELGDVTLVLTGLVDTPLTFGAEDGDDGDDADAGLVGNFQLGARTQLANRWRVGLSYFGQYATDGASASGAEDDYTDNVALSAGGAYGTVLAGDVSGIVRDQTRRERGAGNGSLAFDDVLGELGDRGVGYLVRFGPWLLGGVVDGDAGFDLGAVLQRPHGNKDYRLTARYVESVHAPAGGSAEFDSQAVTAVGELIYGSTLVDLGAGLERLSSDGMDVDRWFTSFGLRSKSGMLSLSVEGHYGRIEGADEVAAAFGLQYDIARGLSANLGFNHAEARARLAGVDIVDVRETKAVLSLRYSF